jgi:hypothetical protein
MPTIGWALIGLAVFLLAGALLTVGVFIGSQTVANESAGGRRYYSVDCRYLYWSGIQRKWAGQTGNTIAEVEAKDSFCPPLAFMMK